MQAKPLDARNVKKITCPKTHLCLSPCSPPHRIASTPSDMFEVLQHLHTQHLPLRPGLLNDIVEPIAPSTYTIDKNGIHYVIACSHEYQWVLK